MKDKDAASNPLVRISLTRLQGEFREAVARGIRLGCLLIESASGRPPHPPHGLSNLPLVHTSFLGYGKRAADWCAMQLDAQIRGNLEDWELFRTYAEQCAKAASVFPAPGSSVIPAEQRCRHSFTDLWVERIFDFAWRGEAILGSTLFADRYVYYVGGNGCCSMWTLQGWLELQEMYSAGRKAVGHKARDTITPQVFSAIDNLFVASAGAIDILLSMLSGVAGPKHGQCEDHGEKKHTGKLTVADKTDAELPQNDLTHRQNAAASYDVKSSQTDAQPEAANPHQMVGNIEHKTAPLLTSIHTTYDDTNMEVTIGGTAYPRMDNRRAFKLFKLVAEAEGEIVSRKTIIEAIPALRGKNTMANTKKKLSKELQYCLETNKGREGGYRYRDPKKKK